MCLARKPLSSKRPGSSSPSTPTGRTFAPRSARFWMALAPPPGSTVRSRCLRIRTGASRETREISPKINSSATRSPTTVIVILGNDSTIFISRSVSLEFLLIGVGRIFSCQPSSLLHDAQHGIHSVSRLQQFHFHRHHSQWLQRGHISTQVNRVFFGGDESPSFTLMAQLQQFLDVPLGVGMMIAVKSFGHGLNSSGSQLQQENLRPG